VCGALGGALRPWEGARRPRESAPVGPDAEPAAAQGAARARLAGATSRRSAVSSANVLTWVTLTGFYSQNLNRSAQGDE
jgi:hypothetical protein